jgi:hypothetical protein
MQVRKVVTVTKKTDRILISISVLYRKYVILSTYWRPGGRGCAKNPASDFEMVLARASKNK